MWEILIEFEALILIRLLVMCVNMCLGMWKWYSDDTRILYIEIMLLVHIAHGCCWAYNFAFLLLVRWNFRIDFLHHQLRMQYMNLMLHIPVYVQSEMRCMPTALIM